MKPKFKKLVLHSDTRGKFVELIKPEDVFKKSFGQVSLTTAFMGQTKGNHYHKRKTEWYLVIQGKGELHLIDLKTKKELIRELSDTEFMLVTIPPNWFHWIKNSGKKELLLLVYCNESFNPADPDTYYELK